MSEFVDQTAKYMIRNTLYQLLSNNDITMAEFEKLLNAQTQILERMYKKVEGKK
jgi:hypothetical protein